MTIYPTTEKSDNKDSEKHAPRRHLWRMRFINDIVIYT